MLSPRRKSASCYSPSTKCCTFWPFLPNYLLGAILIENLPAKSQIQQFIAGIEPAVVLPVGMAAPFSYQIKFNDRQPKDFGNREDLLCPFYEKGNCQIWQHRGSVCSTWFCFSSFGSQGKAYWNTLLDYLSIVEMSLAQECLAMTGFSPKIISYNLDLINQKASAQNGQVPVQDWAYQLMWQDFWDEKESFYLWCYNHIRNLNRAEYEVIIGKIGLDFEKNSLAALNSMVLRQSVSESANEFLNESEDNECISEPKTT